jgi:hypothetical protein
MKRNRALSKATRVARYTGKIASAGITLEQPRWSSQLKRLFLMQNKRGMQAAEQDGKLACVSEFCETQKLSSYVNYVTGRIQPDTRIATRRPPRRRSFLDYPLRCLDEVPKIN